MLELIICGVTLGVCIGVGGGASFFGLLWLSDWWGSRPLKTDSREIVRMHGWEEPR